MSFYDECRAEQKRFYSSKKWIKCRETYLSEHPICERCAAVGRAAVAEHVHHKEELSLENYRNPLIALNPENLEALCFKCHQKEHHTAKDVGDEYSFDERGNLIRRPQG